jgi:hypothetical protein
MKMTEEQKAQVYGNLLNEHTKCFNEINRIKGDNLELNRDQRLRVQELERRQREIMEQVKRLFV